jgi:hypothetical protein
MSKLSLSLSIGVVGTLAMSVFPFVACSSDKGSPATDASTDVASDTKAAIKVTVSGTAAPHPLTTPLGMNAATDFSMLKVDVADPVTVLANPNAPTLATGTLNTSPGTCSPTAGCPWSYDNVDISGISIGLVGIIDDLRTPAASRLWVKTGTGAGASDYINSIKANPAPITDRRLFAVSKATEAKLALFAAAFLPDATIAPGSLETRGFMVGTIIGRLSSGVTPIAGATVAVPATETRVSILYPNDTFMGTGTSTASHGTFLVVPKSATAGAIVTSWTVTAPSTGTGMDFVWPTLTAGSTPGTAFVILFPANEP